MSLKELIAIAKTIAWDDILGGTALFIALFWVGVFQ